MLELSHIPRSTYYYHLKQSKTDKYSDIKQEIASIFTANKQRYGYRRIMVALRQKGIKLNHKTVHRLMRSMGLYGKRRKGKYKTFKGEVGKIAPNIINRDFEAAKPFEKLVTDVTEFAVCACSQSNRMAQHRFYIPTKVGNTKCKNTGDN